MRLSHLLILLFAVLTARCTHERDNPFDPGSGNYAALALPADFSGQSLSPSSIRLTWGNANSRTEGLVLFRDTSNAALTRFALLPKESRGFTDTTCLPYTRYYYRVGAYDKLGDTVRSVSALSVRTHYLTPLDMAENSSLPVPSGFTVQRNGANGIQLAWLGNNPGISGCVIEKGVRLDSLKFLVAVQVPAVKYVDAALPSATRYYSIRTFDTAGFSLEVIDSITPMIKPDSLAIFLTAGKDMDLSWKGNSRTTDSVCIERQVNDWNSWTPLARLGRGAMHFLDTALFSYARFHYRVYAFSGTEKTGPSNEDTMFIPGIFPPVADSATLLCLRFDETSGDTLKDESRYRHNGIAHSASRYSGKFSTSLYLTDSAFADIAQPMDFPDSTLSIEFWMKPKVALGALSERAGILQARNGPFTVYYYYGRMVAEFVAKDNSRHSLFAECDIPPNQWTQIIITRFAGQMKMFINCELKGTQPAQFSSKLTSDTLDIGKAQILGQERYYEGYIDEVKIGRVPEEILKWY